MSRLSPHKSSIKKVLKCTNGQTWERVCKYCTLTVCDVGKNNAEILIQQLNHPKKTFLQHSLLKSDIAVFAPSKKDLSCRWRVIDDRCIPHPESFWITIYFDPKEQSEFQSFVNLIKFMSKDQDSPYIAPRPMRNQQTDSESNSTTSSQSLVNQLEAWQQQYHDLARKFKSMKKEYDKTKRELHSLKREYDENKKELKQTKWDLEVKSAGLSGLQENNQLLMERIATLRHKTAQREDRVLCLSHDSR